MSKTLLKRFALGNISELTVPSTTQAYPLGMRIQIEDDTEQAVKEFIYVRAHDALVAYTPYLLSFGSTAGAEVVTEAPSKQAVYRTVVVPQVAFTSSSYFGFVQVKGDATITSADTTAGHLCEMYDTAATDEGGATYTTSSFGMFTSAVVGAGNAAIYLFDRQVVVDGA